MKRRWTRNQRAWNNTAQPVQSEAQAKDRDAGSWWLGLTRDDLKQKIAQEQARMQRSKMAGWVDGNCRF